MNQLMSHKTLAKHLDARMINSNAPGRIIRDSTVVTVVTPRRTGLPLAAISNPGHLRRRRRCCRAGRPPVEIDHGPPIQHLLRGPGGRQIRPIAHDQMHMVAHHRVGEYIRSRTPRPAARADPAPTRDRCSKFRPVYGSSPHRNARRTQRPTAMIDAPLVQIDKYYTSRDGHGAQASCAGTDARATPTAHRGLPAPSAQDSVSRGPNYIPNTPSDVQQEIENETRWHKPTLHAWPRKWVSSILSSA